MKEYYGNPFEATNLAYAINVEAGAENDGFMISCGENAELEKGKYKVVYEAQKNSWGETDISKFVIELLILDKALIKSSYFCNEYSGLFYNERVFLIYAEKFVREMDFIAENGRF